MPFFFLDRDNSLCNNHTTLDFISKHIDPERTIMYQEKLKKFYYFIFSILVVSMCSFFSIDVCAMSIDDYSYKKICDALPKEYQGEEYVYTSSKDICLIEFANYYESPYRTSVKKTKGESDYLYCVDRNNNIEFTDNYRVVEELFNTELRTRLAMAFYYGPTRWNQKASKEFTTGNSILDYYMTQIVVHALIYDYGDNQSNMGIDFNKIDFKDDTGNLKKKTTAFYEYCRDTELKYQDGYFQSAEFEFDQLHDHQFYLEENQFVSPIITCKTYNQTADVTHYTREFDGKFPYINDITVKTSSEQYNSDVRLSFSKDCMSLVEPGEYNIMMKERVKFQRCKAAIWFCAEFGYADTSQELGNLTYQTFEDVDQIELNLLVGKLHLYKKDSVTGEEITDAQFRVLAFNTKTKQYEYYCDMHYNSAMHRFESENLYLSNVNKDGMFKVIETKPGQNYQLDWEGQEFRITKDAYIHEMHIENEPILGKLTLKKVGKYWAWEEQQWLQQKAIPLPNVHFQLYAKDNIYIKDKVFYSKNQKIVDMVTDLQGEIHIEDLPMGNYYIKETATYDSYILSDKMIDFSISRDKNRAYSHAVLTLKNELKESEISIFKYYQEDDKTKRIPLKGAKFGLYLANDYKAESGEILVKKDTLVTSGITDENGYITFEHLPYAAYYLKELEAPDDFVLNDGIVSINLEDYQYDKKEKCYFAKKDILNKRQEFQLVIEKTGESFVGWHEEQDVNGTYLIYDIGSQKLKDVTFTLYNEHRQKIDSKTTNQDGKVLFDKLLSGTYYLEESDAPGQYKKMDVHKDITIKMDAKEYQEFATNTITEKVENTLCSCVLKIRKAGEDVVIKDKSLNYGYQPLEDVVYGIYQDFNYQFPNYAPVMKNTCVGYMVTDKDGNALFQGKLPIGRYYVKELKTQKNYVLDSKIYYFDITPNHNETIEPVINDGEVFVNELAKASVKIIKTDSNSGKPIKGVEFTLFYADGKQIGVYKTNRKGVIRVNDLPYGEYYFIETKCVDGYYSSNNKYSFQIENDELVELNITNAPILKLGMKEEYRTIIWITAFVAFIMFVIICCELFSVVRKDETD